MPWIPMKKPLLILEQAYGENATYDMAIRIYAVYLEQDMEADGTRLPGGRAYPVRRKMLRSHCDRGPESTIIWMIMTMLQRN